MKTLQLDFPAKAHAPRHHDKTSVKAMKHLDLVDLDPVIHERTRLSILTALFTSREPGCSFSDLRNMLSLTDGNLLAHLRTLEQAAFIERIKAGAGRGSMTTIQLSAHGRKAFRKYLDQLESLVRSARGE
ncbi:MAG TPA: transcriptional regulator [Planctomycetota bacterium]|nr:transcriptional regulator [Planctomycetota bacterium]